MMRRTLLVLIPMMVALALGALAMAEVAEAAPGPMVDRPDDFGPIPVGHVDMSVRFSTKDYDTMLRIYYPGTTSGLGAEVDRSNAPYMTILWMPFSGGTYDLLDFQGEYLASYGAVVVVFGINWTAFPASGSVADVNDLLDHLEDLNVTEGDLLEGMMDEGAFGICGHSSGGGFSLVDGAQVSRIRAVQAWGAAIGSSTVDAIAPMFNGKPVLLQVGQEDTTYIAGSRRAYEKIGAPNTLVEAIGGYHSGPFLMHIYVAFFLYHLAGDDDYFTFVYGDEAVEDVANGEADIFFKLGGDHFFPPVITTSVSARYVDMDTEVTLSATIRGYQRDDDPDLVHEWDVDGDGVPEVRVSDGPNATYAFTLPGQYDVRYNYSLDMFSIRGQVHRVDVSNVPPVAEAGVDVEVDHDGYADLDGSGSTDTASDAGHLLYKWVFSDGPGTNVTSHPTVSRQFVEVGAIVATLTVYDPHGGEGTDTLNITVLNVPPSVTTGAKLTAYEDAIVGLDGKGHDTPSHMGALRYRWDFGDGQTTGWLLDPEAPHAYTRSGNYTATLTVKDPEGAQGSSPTRVQVLNEAPEGTILNPLDGASFDKEVPVEFQATGTDTPSDQVDLLFRWDFGDGEASDWLARRDTEVFHTYQAGGIIKVTLTVRDSDGAEAVTTSTIAIVNEPPEATVIKPWPSATVKEDVTVDLVGYGSDTPGDLPGLTYGWVVDGRTYPGAEAEHTFPRSGVFLAVFTVTDPEGATASLTVEVTVENVVPEVTIDVNPRVIETGDIIDYSLHIIDSPSDMGDHFITWDFGDGGTSYLANGTHAYPSKGTYRVTVTVEDDDGDAATTFVTVTVTDPPHEPVEPPGGNGPSAIDGDESMYLLIGAVLVGLFILVLLVVFFLMRKDMTGEDAEEGSEEPPDH